MSATRTYKSPLREEQVAQTRERILDQVVEILANPDIELTVAEAANRARVSVRTAYRYFPTKEALVDAFNERSATKLGIVRFPKTLEEVPDFATSLANGFAANEAVLRATQRTQAADDVRRRRKQGHARQLARTVDEAAPSADPVVRMHVSAALLNALGFDAWLQLRDIWGLDADECAAAMRWNAVTILAQLGSAAKRR